MFYRKNKGNKGRVQSYLVFTILLCPLITRGSAMKQASTEGLDRSKTELLAKITTLRWIAYSPSTFDPSGKRPLWRSDLEADLDALRDVGFNGLVTYSSLPAPSRSKDKHPALEGIAGMDDIPTVARQMGFEGTIAGVWDPENQDEIAAVRQLAESKLIDAICVGNEGLDTRYTWEKLREAMQSLRTSTGLPVTTTEQIEDYGISGLSDPAAVDWLFPNVHPVFHNIVDPLDAARWTISRAKELRNHVDSRRGGGRLPLLIKETGWPTQGLECHNESAQTKFWDAFARLAKDSKVNFVMFEAFDQPWKHEVWQGKDVGVAWGIFSSRREPKSVIDDEVGNRLYIYEDDNKPGKFIPLGWMPDGQGIAQNTAERNTPHSGLHCIRLHCQLSTATWLGIYFLHRGTWEPDDVFNVFNKLSAKKGDSIKCRFWARSEMGAAVQFKVGGVAEGKIRDSLIFPVPSEYITLGKNWRRYEIDLTGLDLSSVVGAFVWVCDRAHNGNKDISFDLDTIYFVRTRKFQEP